MTTKQAKRKLQPNAAECPVKRKKPSLSNGTAGKKPVAAKKPKGRPVSQMYKKRMPNGYQGEQTNPENQLVETFRKQLLSGAMAISAIRNFLQEVYKNPSLLGHYIRCGGTLKPLRQVLSSCEKEKLSDIADVLHLMHLVMIKSLEFDETHVNYAVKCANSLMTNHQTVICSLLQDQGEDAMNSKASALRLLKAVLLVDATTHWRDVLRLVDISSAKMMMGEYRETVVRQEGYIGNSVRSAFIEFNLAFLIDTPTQMVRFWLARPALVHPLALNLVFDSAENVILIMKTLEKYVLENPDMDKYMYRTAFTTDILKAFVNAYEWVGPEKQVIREEAKAGVLNAVEEFVLPLLTSRRYFLVPKSVELERASPRYRQLLQDLKHTQMHEHQRRLVLGMLEMCPEVLPATLDMYGGMVKLSKEEIRNMIKAMLLLHKPDELIAKLDKNVSAKVLSLFVVQAALPRTILEHIGSALDTRKENIPYCIDFLATMVTLCEEYIQSIESRGLLDQFGRKRVKVEALNKIVALFPSVDRMMAAMALHRDNYKAECREKTLEQVMDILLVCIRSFRVYIESSSLITTFKDLLQPAYKSQVVERYFLNYEFKAVKVVIALEPQSVSFTSTLFPSVLLLLAKAYRLGKSNVQLEATEQIMALFRNTALFGNRGMEIEFWFQALRDVDQTLLPELITYLAKQARAAAEQIGRKAKQPSDIDHALLNGTFVADAEKRQHELDALFARVEQEADDTVVLAGTEALLEAQVELPVADNFFTHIFAAETERPEKFAAYFAGIILRYLHYLPHPEIVQRAVEGVSDNSLPQYIRSYTTRWMNGKEHQVMGKQKLMLELRNALANNVHYVFDASFEKREQGYRRVMLLNMLHQTLFYFCRWLANGKLTDAHVQGATYHCKLLLTKLLVPGLLSERDVDELLESVFLLRPVIFEHFTIIRHDDGPLRRHVSEFVYELMQTLHQQPHFENYTELYSNKIVTELIQVSSAGKATVKLDGEMAQKLQSIFKLNERHCATLLRHYAQLPVDVFVADRQRTYHYQQLCLTLQQLVARNHSRQDNYLPEETVRGLVRLYIECPGQREGSDGGGAKEAIELEELEQALCAYFSIFPHSLAFVTPKLMGVFFDGGRRISKSLIKLATFLLGRSSHFHAPFLELVGQHTAKKELIYPLLNVAFRKGILTETAMADTEQKTLLLKIYTEFKGQILKMLEKPNKAAVIYRENPLASQQLVRLCMPRNECVDFAHKKLRIEAVESFQLRVLMEIYEAALKTVDAGKTDTLQKIYCNGFTVLLQCFDALFRTVQSAHYLLQQGPQLQRMNELVLATYRWTTQAARYQEALGKTSFESVTKMGQWTTFCKSCLKFGIETVRAGENERRFDERLHVLLKLMAVLVELFYTDGNKEQTEIERYYELALSHSNFLRVLLMQHQYKPKTALVHLLYALASKNPSVASAKHVPLLLGAYGATLTDANRYILALLQQYERAGVPMHEFRPFLWGETAIKHFSLESRAHEGDAKNGEEAECPAAPQHSFHTNVKEVFSLLAEEKVVNLIENFPVWRKLDACAQLPETNFDELAEQSDVEKRGLLVDYQPTTPVERFVEKARRTHGRKPFHPHSTLLELRAINTELNPVTYDPAFLLPMMNYIYATEQADMLRRGIRAGILALPFLCLSSRDEQMRLAAGSVLLRIRSHFELTKRITDAKTWLHLFAIVQRRFIEMYATAASYNEAVQTHGHVPRAPFLSMLFIAETVKLLPNVLSKLHGPMTRYIVSQDVYNFRMVPNFLPLFNSNDVEHNVQRMFMVRTLELGVKSHHDFAVLRASPIIHVMMAFHGSPLSNRELNMAILALLNAIAKIPKACHFLVDSLGFIGWLSERIDVIESFEFDTIEAFLGLLSDCWYSMQVMAFCSHRNQPHQSRSTVFFQRGILILTLKFLPLLSTRSSSTTLTRFLNLLEKTTSSRHGYHHLMSLVSVDVMEQLMQYFEELFGEHLWCVRYVRRCGTFAIDDDVTMGRTLQDAGVDQTTILVLLGLRRFVISWCNFQQDESGSAVKHELDEVDVVMEAVGKENENGEEDEKDGEDVASEEEDDDETEASV
uniref:Nucleolar pre-ribosomal-associated protein 1 n=1 Tax=Anopheles epiroticus TaxID=199890 RepID=A0A182PVS9_9DIPT